jgi:micrococcal nuclease
MFTICSLLSRTIFSPWFLTGKAVEYPSILVAVDTKTHPAIREFQRLLCNALPMGEIGHLETLKSIKAAAARADARRLNDPMAKLAYRVREMEFEYRVKQQQAKRTSRPASPAPRLRQRQKLRNDVAAPSITIIALLTFAANWVFPLFTAPGFQSPFMAAESTADVEAAQFGYCHTGAGTNCVVDGDTFWYRGNKVRIADIDTPETHPPRCANEARLGNAATARLQALLNAGPFSFKTIDRDRDAYGRQLRILTRNGESIGGTLVDEGLARWYGGGRQPWC